MTDDDPRDRRRRERRLDDSLDPASIRAHLHAVEDRIDAAVTMAADFLDAHPGHVAWSGGKDSTLTAWLATRTHPDVPIVHYDCGLDFPETTRFLDQTAAHYGWAFERIQVGDGLEAMIANGSWDHAAERGEDPWWETTVAGPAREARARYGDGILWGLRTSESMRRLWTLGATRGIRHRADGVWTCSPVWYWRTPDVWAVHHRHNIPINPLYARLAELGVPETAQRVSGAVGSDGADQGRLVWLRRGWPDLYQRYQAVLPRLREYS